jgi:hypothetical protein
MDLRPRLKEKEIVDSHFRHKAKTRIEHVYDQLSKRTSAIPQRDILDHDIIDKRKGINRNMGNKSVLQSHTPIETGAANVSS